MVEEHKLKPKYDAHTKTDFVAYFDHLTSADYKDVYEPSEDTFLLVDALYYDSAFIKSLCPLLCAEIGYTLACQRDSVGCGFVITSLCALVSPSAPDCKFIGTDINPKALQAPCVLNNVCGGSGKDGRTIRAEGTHRIRSEECD